MVGYEVFARPEMIVLPVDPHVQNFQVYLEGYSLFPITSTITYL